MTERDTLQRYLLEAVASVVPLRGGAYVAGPLAAGRRYFELLASGQETAASSIRQRNEEEMKIFVAALRSRLPYPVIDPGLIKIDDWTAREIGDFYLKIIELFVGEIWLMDGWEYSRGATKEFQFALAHGVRCLDSHGTPISADDGHKMISEVVAHLNKLGIDPSRFIERLAAIRAT
jgi:hypothetical protein